MFFRIDSSRCLQQLGELDRLIAENSRQVLEQRHVLSRLADFSEEAELVAEFVEELLSTQKFYTEDREKLLVALRG
jgi:acetyl-CoA carboxylase carboxyltransferase component